MHSPALSHFAPLPTAVVVAFVIVSTFAVHTDTQFFGIGFCFDSEFGDRRRRRRRGWKKRNSCQESDAISGVLFRVLFLKCESVLSFLLLTNKIDDLIELNSFHFEDERSNFSQCAWRSTPLVLSHDIQYIYILLIPHTH